VCRLGVSGKQHIGTVLCRSERYLDYIASLLTPASDIPSRSSLRSSCNCDLVVPRTSRKIGDRAFSVAAPRAWNRLPTDLKLLRPTASFKSKLKSFLFHHADSGNTVWALECAIGLLVVAHYKSLLLLFTVTVGCRPSVLWHCWLGHVIRKTVSEMTYNVSSGTLHSTIPYHTVGGPHISCRCSATCWTTKNALYKFTVIIIK